MKPLASAAVEMPRSGIRVILDLALKIPDAIHLEIGQPNFPTPKHISEAAYQAALHGFTGYAPNAGLPSLREAIAEKVRRDNHIQAGVDNVIVTTGGMGGLFSALTAILEPGDELLLPDPGYPNFEMIARLCHATGVRYPLDSDKNFLPRLDALPGLVTNRTKALLINSPSNPTGAVIPGEMMAALVDFARQYDLYLISDECYEMIVFDARHVSPASLGASGRVISIFSFSKTYAMTGWRVGYVVAAAEIAFVVSKLQEATVACTSSISQKAAEAALSGSQDCVSAMVTAYRSRRDLALAILRKNQLYSYVPEGAFYLLVDISRYTNDSDRFARDLLEKEKVAVAPGSTFGPEGQKYVRVSLATDDRDLVSGLERLCHLING
jgi:aspartate/methionine/tyrosine aminotransferase